MASTSATTRHNGDETAKAADSAAVAVADPGGRAGDGTVTRAGDGPAARAGGPADLSEVIGRHIRTFRTQQGLSLRQLAERSGLSVGFLSQLERGLTSIGLTNLRDLTQELGHDITECFDPGILDGARAAAAVDSSAAAEAISAHQAPARAGQFTLTRGNGEHTSQYVSGLRTYRMLSRRAAGLLLEPMLVEISPGGMVGELEAHAGEEFAFVVRGELCFTVDGSTHRLLPGDSLHLTSSIPHSLHNDTDQVTVVVSVVTPRLF